MCVVLAVLLGSAVDVPVQFVALLVLRNTNVRQIQVIGTL